MLRFQMGSIIWEPYLCHDENSVANGIKEGTKALKRKTRKKRDLKV